MILKIAARGKKAFAVAMLILLYCEAVLPAYAFGVPRTPRHYNYVTTGTTRKLPPARVVAADVELKEETTATNFGGPGQPESQAFHSVNSDNMVDLFSGDFSYSIPLMDVGGYPLALGYNSGISMDQEASWVGLGWNVNPGAVTRNMRGLPDDFNGTDTVQKVSSMKDNKTIGVTAGADLEVTGANNDKFFTGFGIGGSVGVLHNSYKGWGLESSLNANINVGSKSMGRFTMGLSLTNSSQEGVTTGTSFSYQFADKKALEQGGLGGSVSTGLSYNAREGLKALTFSAGLRQYVQDAITCKFTPRQAGMVSSYISFAQPAFTPSMNLAYTNTSFSYTAKIGDEKKVVHSNFYVRGYASLQQIADEDKRLSLPAYGYLNYQRANGNEGALLDYNRDKEIAYREKPAVPNIGVPSYTYDVFSISGEGSGGMFRAYRGDIGYVHDHAMKSKDRSSNFGVDFGAGDLVHAGVDLSLTRAYTEVGPWLEQNPLATTVAFKKSDKTFESAYFRNPGETAGNTKTFYDAIGGDDVVAVDLRQPGSSSSTIEATNMLNTYRNKRFVGRKQLTPDNVYKATRDKRSQVISYLTAREAGVGGLSKYIENYTPNVFSLSSCNVAFPDDTNEQGVGLYGEYYKGKKFEEKLFDREDPVINFNNKDEIRLNTPGNVDLNSNFSVRWTGRLKVDVTGPYRIATYSDDGVRVYLNDTLLIDRWNDHPNKLDTVWVNLVAGELYNLKAEYYQAGGRVVMRMLWKPLGTTEVPIPKTNLYRMPVTDTFVVGGNLLSREKRENGFRKPDHISEVSVLNTDGRRYVYGLPVYNLKQRDVTFSVAASGGNSAEGLVAYTAGSDNTLGNNKGNDNYFNSEEIPAYAHSFLLTGIVSPDYSDVTGDGISDDDRGTAVKFNYTKIAGLKNAYRWRTPNSENAAYNEGLRTDNRDDKGSYVAGEKELWYLHSIESKTMIATFKLSDREDMPAMNEDGIKQQGHIARKLEEINLYAKADFQKYNTAAKPIKTVHFEYTYELCPGVNTPLNTNGKLTLKRVWFTYNGNDKGKKNPYVFNYNSNNPGYSGKSYDRWGNYKPVTDNLDYTPLNPISNAEYPYAVQDSTLAARNAAAWTLDSIILPGGGRMKIDYESDDYAYVQNKRAAQMFKVAGFSDRVPGSMNDVRPWLYDFNTDYRYIAVSIPTPVSSKEEVYTRYLEGLNGRLYFRLYVRVPEDKFGSGSEYVPCYALIDENEYGVFNNGNAIWIRVKGMDEEGYTDSPSAKYSPMAQAAIHYLRLNLPSKAYPGSDTGGDFAFSDAIKILLSQADNIAHAFKSFNKAARVKFWMNEIDPLRTLVRLNNPSYKKYGGGLRVKRVKIYDNWNAMTKQKESVYGSEYQYTTVTDVNGKPQEISSGVASYEPMIGGEENPWRQPLEYKQQVAALAPVSMGYTEEPLCEAFFPSPSVGYRNVRVRSFHSKNVRSASGSEETRFYTTYDFPVLTDMTMVADGKKRFKPALTNFLRIDARHFVAISQGFKVELNDMNGKLRSHAVYAETDAVNPISYTENFYRTEDSSAVFKHLSSIVTTIDPDGVVDTAATVGEDIELMLDMRQQKSVTNANNFNLNGDFFSFAFPPVFLIPTLWNLAQREEVLFKSVAATKVINRHGLLDRVVAIDKGSKLEVRNLAYDNETGSVVLTSTQNLFGDPVYNFTWPAGWTYDGMSAAYKNVNVVLNNVFITAGKITKGIEAGKEADYFASGDAILVASKVKTGGDDCDPQIASFPVSSMLRAIDANAVSGGAPDIYFVDADGVPFSGNDVVMKVVRSGRKNMNLTVGSATMLKSPLVKQGDKYQVVIDANSGVINAEAVEYKQDWKVADKKKQKEVCAN
jgi:hypothetical protein